jgi:hypothetical protein
MSSSIEAHDRATNPLWGHAITIRIISVVGLSWLLLLGIDRLWRSGIIQPSGWIPVVGLVVLIAQPLVCRRVARHAPIEGRWTVTIIGTISSAGLFTQVPHWFSV